MDLKTIPESKKWLIFTDLDGTLLDHHTYSFAAAKPALDQLKRLGVPVIINSSKTPAEIAQIANELGFDTPQIAENGSVIYYPEEKRSYKMGADYNTICSVLNKIRQQYAYSFSGFHDWSTEEIATLTGLSIEAAREASRRQGSEPLLWKDQKAHIDGFRQLLQESGLELKRGGRFWHVMGQTDKVKAMNYLQQEYKKDWGVKPFTIALGDSANDEEMLAAADVAIIVKNPEGTPFTLASADGSTPYHLIKTTLSGPAGWNEALTSLLSGHFSRLSSK